MKSQKDDVIQQNNDVTKQINDVIDIPMNNGTSAEI